MSLQELTTKRTRVPNFTVEEKSILAKLVNKKKDVIESKATDTKSIMKKKEAWLLIEKEFNRVITVYKRDHTVLKTAWDNIKAQTRKMQTAKRDNVKTDSKSPALPVLKETILRMVEEVACSDTNERPKDIRKESYSFIKKECNSDINVNKPAPSSDKLNIDVHSNDKTLKDKHTAMNQNNIVQTYYQTPFKEISYLSIQIEFEREGSSPIKSENSNDEIIENSVLPTTTNDDPLHKEADLLNSLQLKSDTEHQILKAKLQTALLERQAAKISLETAKLDLALLTKRLKN